MRITLRDTGIPAWAQIEDELAQRIEAGRLGFGERLPPERELAATLGVSRSVVRQALQALAARGLIERGVGRGTFVSRPKVEHDLTRVAGFSEQMTRAGLEPGAVVLRAAVESAPVFVATALGLAAGERAAHVERVRSGGGVALTLEDSWIPDALFPELIEQDLSGSLYALMADRYGLAPVRATERLEPVLARAHEARALAIAPRSALMLVERIAFADDGTAVEFARDRHRGDRARFVIEVAAGVATR